MRAWSLALHGHPSVAITVCVLEAYRIQHVRCPQLAIQSFVKKSLRHAWGHVPPISLPAVSIAYDLYLDIRRRTDERAMHLLGRDSKWWMKHACPACMYKLEGEDKLIFDMLTTMDGNDSLKRVLRRGRTSMTEDEAGEPVLGKSKERVDNRDASDGYMYPRERVERWTKTRLAEVLPMGSGNSTADNPCADRWKNMINNVTSKMWGIFDETGIFLALCRHGFVLVIADMIRSGELAKYPLAIVQELLDTFGMNLGAGYDIGCHFGALSRTASSEASEEEQAQLSFLATYVEGMGLEDLEGCECYFSRSNGLAKSCRYASRFHRQQEITTYAKHFDSFETYANLSKFLCTKYRQALGILKTEPMLQNWMRQEPQGRPKTNEETLEMEAKYTVLLADARRTRGDDAPYAPGVGKAELARRHGKEKVEKDLEIVQELERQLDIADRWTTASRVVSTTVAIKKRKYLLALDALELLIVKCIFELTKMNQSQTGYKMCKHIAKALQARSKAVRNAIDRYKLSPSLLDPPMASHLGANPARQEEIRHLNVEIPRVVTWIRDENQVLRRKEAELSSAEGKTRRRQHRPGDGCADARVYRLGDAGVSLEMRAARREARRRHRYSARLLCGVQMVGCLSRTAQTRRWWGGGGQRGRIVIDPVPGTRGRRTDNKGPQQVEES
ncbi:hypothetical protein B0H14DRAFT_2565708 [Mycena olivaceomarginata]|nr:hypothetical protein B0H14DRAFT_2565708 [Mycena olivaceomarginata]